MTGELQDIAPVWFRSDHFLQDYLPPKASYAKIRQSSPST